MRKEKELTQEKIQKIAEKMALEFWGLHLDMPIQINNRYKRYRGMFKSKRYTNEPVSIELAGFLVKEYNKRAVIEVLKHELCHWALCVQGREYSDGTIEFEKEIVRINSLSNYGNKFGSKLGNNIEKWRKK